MGGGVIDSVKELQENKTEYTCPECGAKGRVRWSEDHKDMIVECPNRKCGYGFIQVFIGYQCNIEGLAPRCES